MRCFRIRAKKSAFLCQKLFWIWESQSKWQFAKWNCDLHWIFSKIIVHFWSILGLFQIHFSSILGTVFANRKNKGNSELQKSLLLHEMNDFFLKKCRNLEFWSNVNLQNEFVTFTVSKLSMTSSKRQIIARHKSWLDRVEEFISSCTKRVQNDDDTSGIVVTGENWPQNLSLVTFEEICNWRCCVTQDETPRQNHEKRVQKDHLRLERRNVRCSSHTKQLKSVNSSSRP